MRVTVVIPALNEAGNIGRLIEETYAAVPAHRLAEVIVVDDASVDNTPDEIKALIVSGRFPGLRYLRHEKRSGQSCALRSGVLGAEQVTIVVKTMSRIPARSAIMAATWGPLRAVNRPMKSR